jgi:plasmid stabilization system protein ParE
MDAYKLSERCDEDLSDIYEFGIERFGLEQAKKYILGLHQTFASVSVPTHGYTGHAVGKGYKLKYLTSFKVTAPLFKS